MLQCHYRTGIQKLVHLWLLSVLRAKYHWNTNAPHICQFYLVLCKGIVNNIAHKTVRCLPCVHHLVFYNTLEFHPLVSRLSASPISSRQVLLIIITSTSPCMECTGRVMVAVHQNWEGRSLLCHQQVDVPDNVESFDLEEVLERLRCQHAA